MNSSFCNCVQTRSALRALFVNEKKYFRPAGKSVYLFSDSAIVILWTAVMFVKIASAPSKNTAASG